MERFSPLFTERERHGVSGLSPIASYRHVYPATMNLNEVAYFFDYEMADALPDAFFGELTAALDEWRTRWREEKPYLRCYTAPGHVRIEDGRHAADSGAYDLRGELADIYNTCLVKPTSRSAIAAALGLTAGLVDEAVDAFAEQGLMMTEGRLALSLAVPAVAA